MYFYGLFVLSLILKFLFGSFIDGIIWSNQSNGLFVCILIGNRYCSGLEIDMTDTIQSETPETMERYSCKLCQQTEANEGFSSKDMLREHLTVIHGNEFSIFCYDCGKGFKSISGLNNHIKLNHNDGTTTQFKCEKCGKCFARKSSLTTHMITHSNVRPFVCNVCGKSYKHKQNLKSHICQF